MIISLLYYFLVTCLALLLTGIVLVIAITLWYKLNFEFTNSVCTSKARLDGKVAIVTGGNTGIGLEVARDLAARGARVVIACRDARKSSAAIADIVASTGNKNVAFIPLDLSKFSSVREFAANFDKSYEHLHILVNNAGCAALKHKPTEDGIDAVMQVNYFGPFLLTNLLLDKLIASKLSRIVIVSSMLYMFGWLDLNDLGGNKCNSHFIKYSNSKMCDILWTKALAKRLPEGVTVNALHPGAVKTNIFDRLHSIMRRTVLFVIDKFFKTPKEGAQTVLHLCVSEELENVSGKYFLECQEAPYRRKVDNDELVEKVWQKSVQMTS